MIINYVLKFMIFKIFEDFLIIYLLLFFLKNRISLYYYQKIYNFATNTINGAHKYIHYIQSDKWDMTPFH